MCFINTRHDRRSSKWQSFRNSWNGRGLPYGGGGNIERQSAELAEPKAHELN